VLEPEEKSRLASARQVDARALESYTRGRLRSAGEDNLEAIRLFEEAVGIAPDFAAGHAALAAAYVNQYFRFAPQEHKQWEKKALIALDTALKLDPDLADAHVTLGWALWTPFKSFQHEEAMSEFQRAAKLNPTSSRAHEALPLSIFTRDCLTKPWSTPPCGGNESTVKCSSISTSDNSALQEGIRKILAVLAQGRS
jgi:tetratricopeptide (TPR) repeat protein